MDVDKDKLYHFRCYSTAAVNLVLVAYLFIYWCNREERDGATSCRCVRSRRDVPTWHRKRLWRKCHGGVRSRDCYYAQLPPWSSRLTQHCYFGETVDRLLSYLLPRTQRRGNIFDGVCLSVSVYVFEIIDRESSLSVCGYIFQKYTFVSQYTRVISSRSTSCLWFKGNLVLAF